METVNHAQLWASVGVKRSTTDLDSGGIGHERSIYEQLQADWLAGRTGRMIIMS